MPYSTPTVQTPNGIGLPENSSIGVNGLNIGQSTPTVTAPGGPGTLGGSTYLGQFGNTVNSIPLVGGSLSGILSSLYGSKPATADPITTASNAITGDIGNLGDISSLTSGLDTISAQNASLPYQMNLPDYEGMLGTSTGNVSSELSGQLPSSVVTQIGNAAAERGVATGQGAGSPNTNAAYLQDLGLNSLNLEQMGQQGFGQLVQQTPTGAPQYNASNMLVTPEEEQQAQQYANMIAAAPDPEAAGLMNTFSGLMGGMFALLLTITLHQLL